MTDSKAPSHIVALIILALFLAACEPLTTQPQPSGWDAEIIGEGSYPQLRGTMGAASQQGATVASLAIQGVPSTAFTWRLATGTCTAPGSGIGAVAAYPEILTSSQGSATRNAELNQMLDPNGSYVVVIRTTEGDIAGCGNLERQVFSTITPVERSVRLAHTALGGGSVAAPI